MLHITYVLGERGPLECLIRHRQDTQSISDACREAIIVYDEETREGYSLLPFDLQDACQPLLVEACGGSEQPSESDEVDRETDFQNLQCIRDLLFHDDKRIQHSKHAACRKGLVEMVEEEARDFRVDPVQQAACKSDLAKFCSDVADDGGRVRWLSPLLMSLFRNHLFDGVDAVVAMDCRFTNVWPNT